MQAVHKKTELQLSADETGVATACAFGSRLGERPKKRTRGPGPEPDGGWPGAKSFDGSSVDLEQGDEAKRCLAGDVEWR